MRLMTGEQENLEILFRGGGMQTVDISSKALKPAESNGAAAHCAECERAAGNLILSRAGASVCSECIKTYYVACSGCAGFIPQDEALSRNELIYCADCFAKPADKAGT